MQDSENGYTMKKKLKLLWCYLFHNKEIVNIWEIGTKIMYVSVCPDCKNKFFKEEDE